MFAIAFALMLPTNFAAAQPMFRGTAIALDGDTLLVTREDGSEVTVGLWALDAPEMDVWPWGPRARAALDEWLALGEYAVICEPKGTSHGRIVARCIVDSPSIISPDGTKRDLAADLIGWGLAVEQRTLGRGAYAGSECFAKQQRRGIWKDGVFSLEVDEKHGLSCK